MHGFNKFRGSQKSLLIELVKSLDLMDPSRLTLQDDAVSSDAFLSLDDVINDLNELKWQECYVTSLQTLNSANLHHQHDGGSLSNSGQGSISTSCMTIVSATKRSRRKLRKVSHLDGSKDSVSTGLNIGSSETATCSPTCWGPRKKRTVMYINLSGNGDGGIVNFGIGVAAFVASAGEVQVQPSAPSSLIVVVDS